nr:conotoxin O3 M6.56ii [Conus magus]
MSGLGIVVLTLLLLVSMATSHQDRGVKRLMLRNTVDDGTCKSHKDCSPDQKCCRANVADEKGFCTDGCTFS